MAKRGPPDAPRFELFVAMNALGFDLRVVPRRAELPLFILAPSILLSMPVHESSLDQPASTSSSPRTTDGFPVGIHVHSHICVHLDAALSVLNDMD